MRPLRKLRERGEQLGDLGLGRRVAEDRQPEGRLGDEDVAGHRNEGQAGRVGRALVVARGDDAEPVGLDRDLRRAEHMAGGMEGHRARRRCVTVSPSLATCVEPANPSP